MDITLPFKKPRIPKKQFGATNYPGIESSGMRLLVLGSWGKAVAVGPISWLWDKVSAKATKEEVELLRESFENKYRKYRNTIEKLQKKIGPKRAKTYERLDVLEDKLVVVTKYVNDPDKKSSLRYEARFLKKISNKAINVLYGLDEMKKILIKKLCLNLQNLS